MTVVLQDIKPVMAHMLGIMERCQTFLAEVRTWPAERLDAMTDEDIDAMVARHVSKLTDSRATKRLGLLRHRDRYVAWTASYILDIRDGIPLEVRREAEAEFASWPEEMRP